MHSLIWKPVSWKLFEKAHSVCHKSPLSSMRHNVYLPNCEEFTICVKTFVFRTKGFYYECFLCYLARFVCFVSNKQHRNREPYSCCHFVCHLSDLARIKISVLFNNSTELAHSTAEHLALRTGIVGFRTACTFLTGPPRGSHCKRYREIETDHFPLMWELSAVPRVCICRRPGSVFLLPT